MSVKQCLGYFKMRARVKLLKNLLDILDDKRKMATAVVKTVIAKHKLLHNNFKDVLFGEMKFV